MKTAIKNLFLLPVLMAGLGLTLVAPVEANAATDIWTNTAGGDWNNSTNWSSSRVPLSGDDVIITNAGTYTVTNASSTTLGRLTLGGTNGIQTLNAASLTLTNASMVNSNGVLNWSGGDLESSLTVAQGGTLTISNTVYFAQNNYSHGYTNTVALTNYGTVVWAGTIDGSANSTGGGGGIIDNAGLWDSVADNSTGYYGYNSPNNSFINTGTLEKIGGTGTTTINWNFASTGTINTSSGTFTLNWNGTSTLDGNLSLASGTTITSLLMVESNAVLNLSGGDLEGSLTVEQGGMLTLSNTVYFAQKNYSSGYTNTAALTNYGTVVWAGTIDSSANSTGGGGGIIDNAGLWESVTDNTTGNYGYTSPNNLFINTGTLEKIGGTGTTTIGWNLNNNAGTVTTPSGGYFSIGNWLGGGLVVGNANFSGGTVSGTIAPGAVMSFSSTTINGAMTVSANAVANWNGGDLEGSLTVEQGGMLTLSNTVYFAQKNYSSGYTNTAALTNYGTVVWAGTIDSSANSTGGGGGIIDNAGLWESVADNSTGYYGYNSPNNSFINTGTLEKIGGTGTTTINWNFSNNGGALETSIGYFTLSGNWIGNGVVHGNGSILGNLGGIIASNAVINWLGGDLEGSLTVAAGGTLTISNTIYFAFNNYNYGYANTAALTNYGTVVWSGAIYGVGSSYGGGGLIDNAGLWESVADNSMGLYSGTVTNLFINTGTLEKIGGTGTTTIGWNFDSEGGALETPVGYFSFSGKWLGSGLMQGNANISGTIGDIVASNAVINWISGDLEGSLTVAAGGTLTISNTIYFAFNNYNYGYANTAALTNYGTVVWSGAIYGVGSSYGGGGLIDNAGLWESVADNSMGLYSGNATNLFINTGTLEKIGGFSTTTIAWNFLNNDGVLGSQTNTLSLTGNYDLTGGTLNFGINSLNNYGIINLSGNPAVLTGTLSANLSNGYLPAISNSFPVLTYGSESGAFTNFNLPSAVLWQTNYGATAFTLTVLDASPAPNLLVNGGFESEPNWGGGVSYDGGETALIGSELPGWTIETNHAVTIHISPGPYLTISGNYSVNVDGEGYSGNNADFYQDFASQVGLSYALEFNWQSWGYVSTPTTSQLEISVEDTVTKTMLFDGLYSYDGSGPHPVHAVLANFLGTGNPLRLRIRESPQSGYNDNTFMVDNFSVTASPSGLVAWWRAENNALDSIGTNNGTLMNGTTFAPGKVGTAFSFNGSGDYVSVPSSPDVQQQNSITIGAWVYAQGSPAIESGIAGTWDDLAVASRTYFLWTYNGYLNFYISHDGSSYQIAADATPLPTNQWVYVAATYDGNFMRLYRNGVLASAISYPGQIATNNHPFLIGRTDTGGSVPSYWKGMIDEVSIYNRALSSNEIAAIYGSEVGLSQPVAPVLNISISSGMAVTASGSGHFVLASSPVVGNQPQSVFAADVNGDGKVDLIVNGLVLTNNGSGGFGSNTTYSVGTYGSACVVAADVNGDGKLDLITANVGGTTLTVLTNNFSGLFYFNATLNVNSTPQCVLAADVNGDNKPDLICASSSGARFLTVFTNNGTGAFVLSSTPSAGNVRAYSVVAADVNGDGKVDLVTANFTTNTLTVFTNKGGGTFGLSANYTVGNSPYCVVTADVNGDGKVDLISANSADGTLTVLTNNGGGVFVSNATKAVGSQPRSVVAADVNGDGKVDLISANAGGGSLTVLTNNGVGVFGLDATITVGNAPYDVVAADVNGDGLADLISANEGGGSLTVLTNTAVLGTGSFKNVVISWSTNSAGFGLRQNSSLSTTNWLDVTNAPALTSGQNQVTLPMTNKVNFFQLVQP